MADVTISGLTDATLPLLGTDKMIVSRNGTTLNDVALSQFPISSPIQTALDAKVSNSTLTESVQDIMGSSIVAGSNVTVTYNDVAGTVTIASSGGGGGGNATNLTTTLTATNVTINSDTGTDATIPATDGTNAGVFLPAEKTKLSGIATGATANSTDAQLRDRATHTGTQLANTISDFASSVRATVLTGLSTATDADITASDTVLSAFGKLQAQNGSIQTALTAILGV